MTMNYDLALELKNAGWPQDGSKKVFDIQNYHEGKIVGIHLRIPTLSELIAECGQVFLSLTQQMVSGPDTHRWVASSMFIYGEQKSETGVSPEIAVAKLWLALNKDLSTPNPQDGGKPVLG